VGFEASGLITMKSPFGGASGIPSMSIVLEVANQWEPSVAMQPPEKPTSCFWPGSGNGHELTCWQKPDGPGGSASSPSVRVIAPSPAVLYSASASEKMPPESLPSGHGCGFVAGIWTNTLLGLVVTATWSTPGRSGLRPRRCCPPAEATCTGPLGGNGSG